MIAAYFARRAVLAARARGNAARDARRWAEAADDYRRYLAFNSGDAAIWIQLGHALSELGDYDGADSAYCAASRLTPDDADLLLCWGHSRKAAGAIDDARELYEQSLALDANPHAQQGLDELIPEEPTEQPAAEPECAPDPEHQPEPQAEAEQPPLPDAPPAPALAGWIERADNLVVSGFAIEQEPGGTVEFRRDGVVIGQARLETPRPEGGFVFKTLLDLTEGARITAHRASDGAELGNSPFPLDPRSGSAEDRRAWMVRAEIAKPFVIPPGGEIALFVTHSATGALKPHILPYLRALQAEGIAVLLIAVTDRQLNIRPEVLDIVAGAIVRANAGYDFAAWAHAIRLYPEVYGASTLYLVNDSVVARRGGDCFARMIARIRASDADLIGLTESHEYRWHLQTFFLALKPRLLASFHLHGFFDRVQLLADKDAVIQGYEVRFAQEMEETGHRIALLFPSPAALNPTLHAWRGLLADGFPFMKLLLLRGAFPEADIYGWREVLAEAGFDVPLIEATLRASEEVVPSDGGERLFAHPLPWDVHSGRPLKVAFYGPWNYDNGLGSASRATIGALRRSDVRLNLHPIKKPFHVHRPLGPAVDVMEFDGPADVAIVHLNPDSWFLLTDLQRDAIFQARKRIGYWVWEMAHIPPAWRHDFSSVDRIWAPSHYCAELFAAQDEAPVDVIPHAVPVLPPPTIDRAQSLAKLGLPAERRLILYVFDGSSYLVRKNPAALVRAFSASGLGARGWTLVLKTKHLMDRPDDGRRFRDLAEATADIVLIDRAMPAGELAELWAAADIYASPHCSEGFGLTIAEAMAAGKRVVATDFGGSADYLDAATGYPVKAHGWRLQEDFGHYTKGGEWARVDEPALTAALLRAADDAEAGDDARGEAARARITKQLSYETVGGLIAQSLNQLVGGRGGSPSVERLTPSVMAGIPFEHADLGPDVRAVALTADGAPRPGATDVPDGLAADRDHWIAFAPAGSLITPLFARVVTDHARVRPDVAIFYADDLAVGAAQAIDQLRLKPEFDLTLLAAQDYVGAPLIVRAAVLADLGGLDAAAGTAAIADLLFRANAAGLSIARIPEVLLVHRGDRVRATPGDYRTMLERQPVLADYRIVPGPAPDGFALVRQFEDVPPLTILIPTRRTSLADGVSTYVEQALDHIAAADWPKDRLVVIVGDDIAGEPAWAAKEWPFTLRRIETPRAPDAPFNYAAKMNRLWRAAETEQILFLNDDVRPIGPGWLKALLSFAVDEAVGGVGARLLYEDGSLQHAGMAPHGQAAVHPWIYRRRAEGSYQEWALTQREWSMVTGAVFATRRSLMEQVNGFDERFSLEFNDADLCLRLRMLGYRIVYTPLAELTHVEKASRGERLPPGDDIALFLTRWKPWLDNDPSWHPRLRRDRYDATPEPEPDAWYL